MAVCAIGADYAQVMSIFAATKIEWPWSILQFFKYLSIFKFNINITAPECAFVIQYQDKWMSIMAVPVTAMAVYYIFHAYMLITKYYFRGRRGQALYSHSNKPFGIGLMVLYFLYLYLLETSVEVLNCGPIISEDGVTDGLDYMTAVPTIVCWEEGSVQTQLFPYAVFYFILYGFGYPLVLVLTLMNKKNAGKAREDQLLRAMNTGWTRETNPDHYDFRKCYHRMYYYFKPETHYWAICVCGRKFFIITCGLWFRKNATFQLCSILLVLFTSYTMQTRNRPYMSNIEKIDVLRKNKEKVQELDTMLKAHDSKYGNELVRHKAKLEADAGENKQMSVKGVELYLFNYNTVEEILVGCAILVNIFGIMFLAEYLQVGSAMYVSLTQSTIIVITFSLSYLMIVMYYEILLPVLPPCCKRCMLNCRKAIPTIEIAGLKARGAKKSTFGQLAGMPDDFQDIDESSMEMTSMAQFTRNNPMQQARESISDVGGMSLEEQKESQDTVRKLNEQVKAMKLQMQRSGGAAPAFQPRTRQAKKKKAMNMEV
jgi:hypothetical protein